MARVRPTAVAATPARPRAAVRTGFSFEVLTASVWALTWAGADETGLIGVSLVDMGDSRIRAPGNCHAARARADGWRVGAAATSAARRCTEIPAASRGPGVPPDGVHRPQMG